MSKVESVVYKCTRSADGSIFAESLELTADCKEGADILQPVEIERFNDLADQMRNIVQEKMSDWPVSKPKAPVKAKFPKEYDEARHIWTACPLCGSDAIDYVSLDGKTNYQKCQRDRIYLNEDGTTKAMPPRQMGGKVPQPSE